MQGSIDEHDNLGTAHSIAQLRFVRRARSPFSTPSLGSLINYCLKAIMSNIDNALTKLAEERLQHYDYHGTRMWVWHGWLVGWTHIANVLVPFGLAALLYIPDDYRSTVTLELLAISGLSLALQLLTTVQQFRNRSLQLRALHAELQPALAEYRVGLKTDAEFSEILEKVMKKHTEESAP